MTTDATDPGHDDAHRLGAWARADTLVGVVARIDGDTVTVFDPGARRRHDGSADGVRPVPAASVRVTVTVDLPLAHGLDETALRRWTAMLLDPVLRERATEALAAEGLDPGIALPIPQVAATALRDGLARCLCGTTTPAAPGATPPPCPSCGRQPAPPAET